MISSLLSMTFGEGVVATGVILVVVISLIVGFYPFQKEGYNEGIYRK